MNLDQYYLEQDEPNKSCLLSLRSFILALGDQISETRKYGMPCFCYAKKPFCYLWTDKKTTEPYILMVEGNFLIHHALESGDRARMKILRINPHKDLDLKLINEVLYEALSLYQNGLLKVK